MLKRQLQGAAFSSTKTKKGFFLQGSFNVVEMIFFFNGKSSTPHDIMLLPFSKVVFYGESLVSVPSGAGGARAQCRGGRWQSPRRGRKLLGSKA